MECFKKSIVKQKIKSNKEFYERLRNLDESITDSEAEEIMYRIVPRTTTLLKVTNEKDFVNLLNITTTEGLYWYNYPNFCQNNYNTFYPFGYMGVYNKAMDKIFFIRGERTAAVGETFYDINGRPFVRDAIIDEKQEYIIVKQLNLRDGTEYQVIVYIP